MQRRFLVSLSHALRGIGYVWKEEINFRIQTAAGIAVLLALIAFRFTYSEAAIIIFAMMLVLGGEMFNTLVEDLLDVIQPEHHRSVGRMKDMMAGVVLLLSIGAALVGLLVFLHHFESSL
jgi:diacylglycerol kinase